MPHFIVRLAIITLAALAIFGCTDTKEEQPEDLLQIKADDVAWATDVQVLKIDLTEVGPFYAAGLVVVDHEGTVVKQSATLMDMIQLTAKQETLIATVAIQKKESTADVRLRINGTTTSNSIENIFKENQWFHLRPASQAGGLYYLCGDSAVYSVSSHRAKFEDGSHQIALKLYRTEKDYYQVRSQTNSQ